MTENQKKLILEYAELGLKGLPRRGEPGGLSEAAKSRMEAIRGELGMTHAEILSKGAQILCRS